jgi:hypothetical protein
MIARCAALGLFAGAVVVPLQAAATMYKWVDEKGQVIYSDQPPPPNIKSEVMKPPPPPANPNAVKEMVNAETEMKLREKQRVEKAKEAEKARADAEKKREICASAQKQVQTLQRQDLYRFDDKGQRVYLDADTRKRETEEAQKVARDHCV